MAQLIDSGTDFTPPPITPEQAGSILQSLGLPLQNPQQGQDVPPPDTGTYLGPQQQDAPPSSAQLGTTAQEASQSLYNGSGVVPSIVSLIGGMAKPVVEDVAGKAMDLRSLLGGPKSDYFNSPDAASNAINLFGYTKAGSGGAADARVAGELASGAKAAAGAASEGLAEAAPKAAGSFADAMGLRVPTAVSEGSRVATGAEDAAGYTVRQVGPNTHIVVNPQGKDGQVFSTANGFKGDPQAAAEARAAELNVKYGIAAPKTAPTIADASASFNQAAGTPPPDFARMAGQLSTSSQQAIRQTLRGERDLTPAEVATVNAESTKILAANQSPATPENVSALADAVRAKQQASNAASRANGRAPTAAEAVLEKNATAVRKAVSDAVTPASQIEGGLTARIGGKGSLGVDEGAGPMGAQNVATRQLAKEADIRAGRAMASDVIPGSPQALDSLGDSGPVGKPEGPKVNPASAIDGGAGTASPRIPGASTPREPAVNVLLREGLGLARAGQVLGHLGVLRQELPGLTYAASKGRVDIIGNSLAAIAHGVAHSPEAVATKLDGLKSTIARYGLDGKVFLNNPNGHVSQAEESMIVGRATRTPGVTAAVGAANGILTAPDGSTLQDRLERGAKGAAIGAAFGLAGGRLNQGYAMGINQLRTDIAVGLAKNYQKIGNADPVTGLLSRDAADKVGHFVNVLTGRGDLIDKIGNKLAGPEGRRAASKLQDVASGVFYGPRLMTSTWQQAADTIAALGRAGGMDSIRHPLTEMKPLDPARVATIQATLSLVAFGTGVMGLAKSQGLQIGTDSQKNDWGIIHMPDGAQVDMWGGYRTFARAVAQELEYGKNLGNSIINGTKMPSGPYAKTGGSILGSYFRGKLNPPAGVVNDFAFQGGKNAIGQPASLDAVNPARTVPFGVGTAQYAFGSGDAHTPAGPGGALGAAETALTSLGAGVHPPTLTPHRDGLGRLDDGALPATPVTDAWANAQKLNPSLGNLAPTGRSIDIGPGKKPIVLDDKETDALRVFTGNARNTIIGQVVSSPKFQQSTPAQQEKLLVGAKIAADQQGKIQFALDHAKTATNDMGMVRAVTIGLHAATTTSSKMNFVAQLSQQNTLTDVAHSALDDLRTQPDPLKANYQPTVNEYLKGNDLIQRYIAAPAFKAGTPQDWAEAARHGTALHATYLTLQREAQQASTPTKKVSVEQLPDYKNYIHDYNTARTSTGRPVSAFITKTGSIDPNMVTPQRLAIMKDPVFNHFLTVAKARDPYSIKATN